MYTCISPLGCQSQQTNVAQDNYVQVPIPAITTAPQLSKRAFGSNFIGWCLDRNRCKNTCCQIHQNQLSADSSAVADTKSYCAAGLFAGSFPYWGCASSTIPAVQFATGCNGSNLLYEGETLSWYDPTDVINIVCVGFDDMMIVPVQAHVVHTVGIPAAGSHILSQIIVAMHLKRQLSATVERMLHTYQKLLPIR